MVGLSLSYLLQSKKLWKLGYATTESILISQNWLDVVIFMPMVRLRKDSNGCAGANGRRVRLS